MKKIIFILPALVMSFVITNCSDKGNSPAYVDSMTFDDPNAAKDAVENLDISCEDKTNCPESVGGLVYLESKTDYKYGTSQTKYSMGVCSQTLIAPNRILTNRHCLPSSSLYRGTSCSNITVLFPETSSKPYQKVSCKTVVDLSSKYSEDSALNPDWAILELSENVDRKFVDANTSGVDHNSDLTAYPVYYEKLDIDTSSGYGKSVVKGKIKKVSCQSKMNSLFAIYYNHPQSPILSLICDQEVIKGNSGSGLFDTNGKLPGVISMAIKDDSSTRLTFMGETKSVQNKFAGGTNAHCIEPFNSDKSAACKFDENDGSAQRVGYLLSMVFGQEATQEEQNKYETLLNADDSVKWEDHNVDIFSQIYSPNYIDSIASIIGNDIATFSFVSDQKIRFPKTPKCISSSRKADKDFIVSWPMYDTKYKGMVMSDLSLISAPLEAANLELKMNYDDSKSAFIGKLIRLDDQAREDLMKIDEEIGEKFRDCFTSDWKYKCDRLYEAEQRETDLIKSGIADESLFANEDFIENSNSGTNEIVIPSCE